MVRERRTPDPRSRQRISVAPHVTNEIHQASQITADQIATKPPTSVPDRLTDAAPAMLDRALLMLFAPADRMITADSPASQANPVAALSMFWRGVGSSCLKD